MAPAQPRIANYDEQTADQVTQRLRTLSQADLAKLEAYERDGQARSTVLDAIASLREREPWSGYDDMEVEEVNAALRERDGDAAGRVLEYERRHKGRSTVIKYAERRRETPSGGSREKGAARPRSKARATRSRQPSAGTGSTARSASRKGQSKSSSSGGSGSKTKARGSSRNAKGASRSGSSSSSGTAARPKSSSATTGARRSASRSSSGSSRSSGTSARSKSSSASSGARRSASRSSNGSSRSRRSSAKRSRAKSPSSNGTLDTVKNAASRASGPAVAAGAVATGVAAGIALKSRTRRKNVLGVPLSRTIGQPKLPRLGMRSVAKTVGKASKQLGQTSKSVSKRAERFGAQAKQAVKTLG
jgi:hypothetical protein